MIGYNTCLALALCYMFFRVNKVIDFPYMDEYFHVRQTVRYITEQDFTAWDDKITTPPGLYIVGYAASRVLGPSLQALRSVNLIPLVVSLLLAQFGSEQTSSRVGIVCGFPLLAFYANLYYTDVWATLLVLGSLATERRLVAVALLSLGLWFRQTNIIWAALAAAFRAFGERQTLLGAITHPGSTLRAVAGVSLPYGVVALQFACFVAWNGGIALGDKSNHQFSLHLAQLLYFSLFFLLFSAPILGEALYRGGARWARRTFGRPLLYPVELLVIYGLIRYGTIVHPFILADNRHYTFYIWRRLITPAGGLLMVPFYWVSWRWFASTVDFSLARTWAYAAAVCLVLVPSPLMEPRYYILPYLVWRLYLCGVRRRETAEKADSPSWDLKPAAFLENEWYLLANWATVYVLMGSSHFMW